MQHAMLCTHEAWILVHEPNELHMDVRLHVLPHATFLGHMSMGVQKRSQPCRV